MDMEPEADAEEGDASDVEEAMDDVEEAIAELRVHLQKCKVKSCEEPRNGAQKWKNQQTQKQLKKLTKWKQ